jgi:hypothetical protein
MGKQQATNLTDVPRSEVIARLNDQLRKTGMGGAIMITRNVMRMTGFDAVALAAALANYNDFEPSGDPHGERDFGCMTLWGHDLLWKVDYYDRSMEFGSDDPADPEATHRVLTVMLAADW